MPALSRLIRAAAVGSLLLLVGAIAYGVLAPNPVKGIDERLSRNGAAPAPPFTLAVLAKGHLGRPLTGRVGASFADHRVALSALRGVPVVLNFWITEKVTTKTRLRRTQGRGAAYQPPANPLGLRGP